MSSLLTTLDVSRLLRVGPPTLKKWREVGIGPDWIVLEGRTVRYRKEDVVRFIRQRARVAKREG